jgi:hypothetical protein
VSELDDVLEHYGVKGMRWGQRNSENSSTKPPASADATVAAKYKTTAKKGGSKALSNAELQALVTRMNLEKQYSTLNPSASKKVAKFAADMLLGVGKQQVARVANDYAAKQIAKAMAGK